MTTGSGAKKATIFDKLTDTSQYTGSHQHRFDRDGKGRGIAGRDRIAKGSGTTDTPYDDGAPIRDLSQITRTNLRSKDAQAAPRPKSSKQVKEAKQHRCREKNCVNSCSPTSKQGFCSYHMWQENEAAKYPKNGRAAEPSTSPEPVNRRHQRSTSSLCQVPQCGNDRGPDGFCLVHASSAKQGGAAKPDVISEENDEKPQRQETSPGPANERCCVIQSCNAAVYRMGYCRAHFQEMQSLEDDHAEDKQTSAGSSPSARQAKGNATAADKALSRLTDPKLYTGSHQHRFDKHGHGVGLDGRDSVAKGSGTAAKYHGGKISDISQVLRQG